MRASEPHAASVVAVTRRKIDCISANACKGNWATEVGKLFFLLLDPIDRRNRISRANETRPEINVTRLLGEYNPGFCN